MAFGPCWGKSKQHRRPAARLTGEADQEDGEEQARAKEQSMVEYAKMQNAGILTFPASEERAMRQWWTHRQRGRSEGEEMERGKWNDNLLIGYRGRKDRRKRMCRCRPS